MANETIPTKLNEKIQFFEQRLPVWSVSPPSLGLLPADIVSLNNAVTAARAAFNAAQAARNLAKAATEQQDIAVAAMLEIGRAQVRVIRAWAFKTNNPAVYAMAQIPAPAEPSPLGPAEQPTDLTTTLTTGGTIELAWQGSREGGTSFKIFRSLKSPNSESGPFVLLGTSEERRFTDSALPTGLQNATYYIIAVRSGGASLPSDVSTVFFGSAEGNPIASKKNLTIAA
ncbi:MAG: hypothetical protein KF757_08405 [Phycisphaeraceae bacterium]|nr:hypothetical protein [Phycisphaeraceae bacterium]MCW5762776.1 hypothetical protein [Phycisphaeraceae bacterium]